jgi:hypothetical protein
VLAQAPNLDITLEEDGTTEDTAQVRRRKISGCAADRRRTARLLLVELLLRAKVLRRTPLQNARQRP